MTLGERIKCIISERHLKQIEFADALGISPNYVNLLVNGKKEKISDTLSRLIEETYGYSSRWIMTGEGEKNSVPSLSATKIDFIKRIQKMPDNEVAALLAFANSLDIVKQTLTDSEKAGE